MPTARRETAPIDVDTYTDENFGTRSQPQRRVRWIQCTTTLFVNSFDLKNLGDFFFSKVMILLTARLAALRSERVLLWIRGLRYPKRLHRA